MQDDELHDCSFVSLTKDDDRWLESIDSYTNDWLQEHWRTFILEKDFQFMEEKGLDAVRIPVGWWIASGSKPPAPFVGGSLEALDNAFTWAG